MILRITAAELTAGAVLLENSRIRITVTKVRRTAKYTAVYAATGLIGRFAPDLTVYTVS